MFKITIITILALQFITALARASDELTAQYTATKYSESMNPFRADNLAEAAALNECRKYNIPDDCQFKEVVSSNCNLYQINGSLFACTATVLVVGKNKPPVLPPEESCKIITPGKVLCEGVFPSDYSAPPYSEKRAAINNGIAKCIKFGASDCKANYDTFEVIRSAETDNFKITVLIEGTM